MESIREMLKGILDRSEPWELMDLKTDIEERLGVIEEKTVTEMEERLVHLRMRILGELAHSVGLLRELALAAGATEEEITEAFAAKPAPAEPEGDISDAPSCPAP